MSNVQELKLTEDQEKEIRWIFNMMDENGDGQLNVKEIVKASQIIGMNPTNEEASEMVREADTNGNGCVEFEEFFEVMKPIYLDIDEDKEKLTASFKILDRNSDGFISVKELRFVLNLNECPFTEEELDEIMRDADTNGDGKIDYKADMLNHLSYPNESIGYKNRVIAHNVYEHGPDTKRKRIHRVFNL